MVLQHLQPKLPMVLVAHDTLVQEVQNTESNKSAKNTSTCTNTHDK